VVFIISSTLNTEFCESVFVIHFLVICVDLVYVLLSHCVFRGFPSSCVLVISTVSVVVTCIPVFNMWVEYLESLLLFLILCVWFLNLVQILSYIFEWAV
jgi:hypothetical protein